MSEVLQSYRDRFPAYGKVDDETLARAIYDNTPLYKDKLSYDDFRSKIGMGSAAAERPPAIARDPFTPGGTGSLDDTRSVSPIDDERMLEGTGLPPGTQSVNVGRSNPRFSEVLARSGETDQRIVRAGNRDYMVPRQETAAHLPPDPNTGEGATIRSLVPIPLAEQLANEGVVAGEAPASTRLKAGFGVDPGSPEAYRNVMGPDTKIGRVTSAGPAKGAVTFQPGPRPGEDQPLPQTVARPSPDEGGFNIPSLGDLASQAGEFGQMITAGLGGLVGAWGGSLVVGGGIGTGAGAAAGELGRLVIGRKVGAIPADTDTMDLVVAAVKRGAVEGSVTAALGGVIRAIQAWKSRGIDIGIDPANLEKALADLNARIGPDAAKHATVSRVMAGTPEGEQMLAMEKAIASSPPSRASDAMREKLSQSEQFLGREAEAATPLPGGFTPDDQALGEAVSRAAPDAAATLRAQGPRLDPGAEGGARAVRSALGKAQEAEEAAAQAIYREAERPLHGLTTKPIGTDMTVREYQDILRKDIFKSLGEEDRKLIASWFDEVYQVQKVGDEEKMIMRPIDYQTLDRGLKSIRRAIRDGYKGEWKGDLSMLLNIEESLVADRTKLISRLQDGKQILAKLEQAEGAWKEIKDTFRRTRVHDLFRQSQGKYSLGEEGTINRVIGDPETAREVGKLLSRPEFAQEKSMIRRMMRWEASRAARAEGGDINEKALGNWVNDNMETLKPFFSPDEIKNLYQPGTMMRMRRAMNISEGMNEAEWFSRFFGEGGKANPKNAQITMDRLRNLDASLAEDVKNMSMFRVRQLLTTTTDVSRGKTTLVDADKVEKFLNEPGRLEWMRHVAGPEFGARMRKLTDAATALRPKGQRIESPPAAASGLAIAESLKTGGRIFLGALSQEARTFNAALRVLNKNARDNFAEALMNPSRYITLLKELQGVGASSKLVTRGTVPAADFLRRATNEEE